MENKEIIDVKKMVVALSIIVASIAIMNLFLLNDVIELQFEVTELQRRVATDEQVFEVFATGLDEHTSALIEHRRLLSQSLKEISMLRKIVGYNVTEYYFKISSGNNSEIIVYQNEIPGQISDWNVSTMMVNGQSPDKIEKR